MSLGEEEDGGADGAFPSWVEGGNFSLKDGSQLQLCTRIMWFDDGGHLLRVIVNQVRCPRAQGINFDVRLFSARPDLCQMSGLGIHQACSLEERR